jgi:hypothetical protein
MKAQEGQYWNPGEAARPSYGIGGAARGQRIRCRTRKIYNLLTH